MPETAPEATTKTTTKTMAARVAAKRGDLSAAEYRVASFLLNNPQEALLSSAQALAERIGTSDATVVRAARALGFGGLNALRRAVAEEMGGDPSAESRMVRTLDAIEAGGGDSAAILEMTLSAHEQSLADVRRDVTPALFLDALNLLTGAERIAAFGIGPTSAIADYARIQLTRLGAEALAFTQSGLLLADDIVRLRKGDVLVLFVYGRVYREVSVLLEEAEARGLRTILVSDTLGKVIGRRVDLVLPVPRGRADMVSLHAATMALVEALLVGYAAQRPSRATERLHALNRVRAALTSPAMKLDVDDAGQTE